MSITITLLGTGSPMPSPDRAGPSTLVSTGEGEQAEHYLVDAGRGVLMRLAAAGLGAADLAAVLITHLHSDHITDLNDVITTRWVMTFTPTPLTIVGPVGTRAVVNHILASLGPDIEYRIAHHEDLNEPPPVSVIEVESGPVPLGAQTTITCAPTDHKPVEPSIGFRFDHDGASVVTAGDTVPCVGLDSLCHGADAVVHTVIRKDIIADVPLQRLQDTLDYHSSPEQAAQTAARAGVGTLVLTHYVPAIPTGGDGADWRALAAEHFDGAIELGDDLHTITVAPTTPPTDPSESM
ncbi:MAG: ribonuclease Z [Ilumatobacteraceae bacterium]|nr:ribonuclease Z [Ilumatobacteraceae bacterium]